MLKLRRKFQNFLLPHPELKMKKNIFFTLHRLFLFLSMAYIRCGCIFVPHFRPLSDRDIRPQDLFYLSNQSHPYLSWSIYSQFHHLGFGNRKRPVGFYRAFKKRMARSSKRAG